ncbi:hypothetical protein AAIB33_06465 [Microbacterium sp. AZCO]|uniref:hypothetical protein n=1 Tax=Microbacterium sp. AZCO TaxID=3142976 RepID=UPI0031F36067
MSDERADLRARLIVDGRRVWGGNFMSTSDLIAKLVELRPELWGTISHGQQLTPQKLEGILRGGIYPTSAHSVRAGRGPKGRWLSQWQLLVDTVPTPVGVELESEHVSGDAGVVVQFDAGAVERLAAGEACMVVPIVRISQWDRAPRRVYLVTVPPGVETLGA